MTANSSSSANVNKGQRQGTGWGGFWFSPGDPTTLGMIRVFAGLIVLYVHLAYCYDLQEFFGKGAWINQEMMNESRLQAPVVDLPSGWDASPFTSLNGADPDEQPQAAAYIQKWGIHPSRTLAQGSYAWSLWFHVQSPTTMWAIHGAILLIMALFTIGFCTRITSVLTWLAALNYIHRSPTTVFGMDTMMNIALLYLMIGPSGAAFSVDRLLARRGYRWFALLGWGRRTAAATPEPMVSANFALRLMQVHYCIIYAAAGTAKLLGGAWWNGTALWWTAANYEFTALRLPPYFNALRWLCAHRWLWEILFSGGVVYTILLQLSFPFLVWLPRWRWLMVSGSVILHTGIAVFMGLTGFGLLMLALVLSFVPGEVVRRRLLWAPNEVQPEASGVPGVEAKAA
jgi:hypothetical protein